VASPFAKSMNVRVALTLAALPILTVCGSSTSPAPPTRSYYMGFTPFGVGSDTAKYVNTVLASVQHADAAMIFVSPLPWGELLAGVPPESLVLQPNRALVTLYRQRGMMVAFQLDLTDGLDRSQEAPSLAAAGHSITEPAVQLLYRRYALALDTLFRPDYLGLAAETNLIRADAPAPVYAAVVAMTNGAASDISAIDSARSLFVSEQVEQAWGRLGGGTYIGIEQDFTDFPFIKALGLSSYPFLGGFSDPSQIPDDYYTRLTNGRKIPLLKVEGGWASASAGSFVSDPAKQARYLQRHRQLLDAAHATATFQLYADIDTTGLNVPPNSVLLLLLSLGVVDKDLNAKPALAVWDSTLARRRVP